VKAAKPRLERIETDILNNFKRLGVAAEPMNGTERLRLLHGMLHMDEQEPFRFSWDWLAPSGLSVKDFIAPSSFEFRTGRSFGVGRRIGCTFLADFSAGAERQDAGGLPRHGKLPHRQYARPVRGSGQGHQDHQAQDHRFAENDHRGAEKGRTAPDTTWTSSPRTLPPTARRRRSSRTPCTAATSQAPLYFNLVQPQREAAHQPFLLTEIKAGKLAVILLCDADSLKYVVVELLIFIPFTTQELFQDGKEALYCGLNALSNNLIMVDRKRLKNPNGLILGTPGSGKSFAAKREIANVFLVTDDDIIICDPEAEYGPLVERLHGQVIKISPTSPHYINPMDLNLNYSDDDPAEPEIRLHPLLCELIVGGKDGLMPVEKTIIDRCVRMVYRDYLSDPVPENMPILEDLYNELRRQEEKEAQYIATALEIYVSGSLNVFNHRTNINIANRIVSFDIKELGKQLKKIGMLIVQGH